jgi:hypothetical protein
MGWNPFKKEGWDWVGDTVDFVTDWAAPIGAGLGFLVGGGPGAKIGAGLGSMVSGSSAASDASKAQQDAAEKAFDIQWRMYQQSRQDNLPWLNAGNIGLSRLTGMPTQQLADPNFSYGQTGYTGGQVQGQEAYNSPVGVNPDKILAGLKRLEGGVHFNEANQDWEKAATYLYNKGIKSDSLLMNEGEGGQRTLSYTPPEPTTPETPQTPTGDGTSQPSGTAPTSQGGLLDGPQFQDFEESPYYQYGLEEQLRATDRFNASRGLYGSGKAAKDLQKAANFNAMGNYGSFVNDWIATKLNPAQSLAGLGQTAGLNMGNQALNAGGYMGSAAMNAGNARASGYLGRQNTIDKGLQGVGEYISGNPQAQNWIGGIGNTISGWFGGGGSQIPSNPYQGYGTNSSWYAQPGAGSNMYTGGIYGL